MRQREDVPASTPSPPRARGTTRLLPAPLLLALALSCCGGGAVGSAATRGDRNLLTAEDLQEVATLTVYEAIERLRPGWLRLRGVTSARTPGDLLPAVMVDESQQDFDILHSLRAGNVESLRIMDGPDATTRYGTGFVNGIIHVTMPAGRRRP